MSRYIYQGDRFGRLEVNGLHTTDKWYTKIFKCTCDCGNIVYARINNLNSGRTKSCGCLWKETRRKEKGESAFNSLHYSYRKDAECRNIIFKLSKEEFKLMTKGNCYYCDIKPKNKFHQLGQYGEYIYNGIDRVDSSLGYIKENCVSCCKRCNQAKNDMPLDEFYLWINRLYSNLLSKEII